jgi:ubiquinone/menaquinone biosynthesis C-methylase UbiE
MTTAKNDYKFGYGQAQVNMFQKWRTIDNHGEFIKPYLQKGSKVLDCGCGPGSITLGIAKLIAPGQVIGIDISDEQIKLAQHNAKKQNIGNAIFQQPNVFELPFADNTFDLVFEHAMLNHLANPLDAIKEQIRVVKPGGFIAAKDGLATIIYPQSELLKEADKLYHQPIKESGGDSYLGLKLKELFHQAGLQNIQYNIQAFNWPIDVVSDFRIQALETSTYNQQLLYEGKLTAKQIQIYQQAWRDFANAKGAIFSFVWGCAIGKK